jgi:hypothetical protein
MAETDSDDLKEAEMVCRRFMALNLEVAQMQDGNTKGKLAKILGSVEDSKRT